MIKVSSFIGMLAFMFGSWMNNFSLPRLTHGAADYLLMPLLGYIMIIIAAQVANRVAKDSY